MIKFCKLKEAQFVLNTILEVQPKESGADQGKSSSDIAYEVADMIMARIQPKIDPLDCNPDHKIVSDEPNLRVPSH